MLTKKYIIILMWVVMVPTYYLANYLLTTIDKSSCYFDSSNFTVFLFVISALEKQRQITSGTILCNYTGDSLLPSHTILAFSSLVRILWPLCSIKLN